MSSRRIPPPCETAPKWLESVHGQGALAALTGQDARALSAFVHLLDLYSVADGPGCASTLGALTHVLLIMQPSTRSVAKRVIAHVLGWSDEERLWARIAPQP